MIHGYPKVWNLGHPQVEDLFKGPVLLEEKIDGSQFSFGVFNGELQCRSKNLMIDQNAPGMFEEGVEAAQSLVPEVHKNWTYRTEYLRKSKHNALAYDRIPRHHMIVFDIDTGVENYAQAITKKNEAERLGLETVPTLGYREIHNVDDFKALLETDSILGGQKIEGVVIKNYNQWGRDNKVLMGKYVNEQFRELNKKNWRNEHPTQGDIVQRMIDRYRTESRWAKCVQHLRDQEEIVNAPEDIGKLIKEFSKDFDEECSEEIATLLWDHFKKKIISGCAKGLPEWYKEKLLEKQFGEIS